MPRQTKEQRDAAALQMMTKLVDEYGRLDAEVSPYKAKIRRLEEIGKSVRAFYTDLDPEQTASLTGSEYGVALGPRGYETKILSMADVYRTLGPSKFLKACSMTIKSLEASVAAAELVALTKRERTGSRPIQVFSVGPTA